MLLRLGMGSIIIPERLTSYQLSLEENVTVADEARTLAARLKVTTPPAARRLFKQVVTPGAIVFKPTVGVAPQLGISNSKLWDPRKVRVGGRIPAGVTVGIEKSSPPKKGSAIPPGRSDKMKLGKRVRGLSTSGWGIHPIRSTRKVPTAVLVGGEGTGVGG